jgi:hypothetical protein
MSGAPFFSIGSPHFAQAPFFSIGSPHFTPADYVMPYSNTWGGIVNRLLSPNLPLMEWVMEGSEPLEDLLAPH